MYLVKICSLRFNYSNSFVSKRWFENVYICLRYKHLVGKNLVHPIVNRKLPVIADDYVDMNFGTGN